MKKFTAIILVLLQVAILTACVKTPSTSIKDGVEIADNIPSQFVDGSEDETSTPDVKPEDTTTSATEDATQPTPPASANTNTLLESASMVFNETIQSNGKTIIMQNTPVEIAGIENVSLYNYTILPLSDSFREALFSSVLGDKEGEIEHSERNNIWKIRFSDAIGDYFQYNAGLFYASESVAGQDVFRFEYHDVNLYPFDDNILESVEQSSMATSADEAVALCQDVLCEIAPDAKYCVDNLLAYGSGGRHQFYKIVFKKMVDNIQTTGHL